MKKCLLLICGLFMCTTVLFSQQSSWRTEKGWVMKKAPGCKKYKRFFAIGIWNVPGYNKIAMEDAGDDYRESTRPFFNGTKLYNMVFMNPGKPGFPNHRIEIMGSIPFYKTLKAFQKSLPGLAVDKDWQYKARNYLREHPDDSRFVSMMDSSILDIRKRCSNTDHVWAQIDEIVQGGSGGDWSWYPEIGEQIAKRIKKQEKNTLIYTDLMGMPRGNSYLFALNYFKTHKTMPKEPPYEILPKVKRHNLNAFAQSYDGTPVYIDGTFDYTPLDSARLIDAIYTNIKLCSKDYKQCGDVFGVNVFMDTNRYPILSGISVDAIKEGVGEDRPVWIFFDGNGYAVPDGESVPFFIKNLKCQMYTSLIHGATGVMFWNDREKSTDIFNGLNKVVAEMTARENVLKMDTEKKSWNGDLHYMIKKNGKLRYLIASNTNKKQNKILHLPGMKSLNLRPLDVMFIKLM